MQISLILYVVRKEKKHMKGFDLRMLTLTGVFTALIFVFTAFVHVPSFTGYVHVGDGFLFLAASILPLPYALFSGVTGAVLSDCLTGFVVWAPASLIIKATTVFFFTWKKATVLTKRNMMALIPAGILCIGGYYLYEVILSGNFVSPAYGAIGNLLQAAFSSIVYLLAGTAIDKAKLKARLSLLQRI